MTQLPSKAALRGEILRGVDTVRVVIARHPLRNERQDTTVPAGMSVSEIAALVGADRPPSAMARDFVAFINGHPIEAVNWSRVRPRAGATLVLRAVVADPISGVIAAIVGTLSAASTALSSFLGAGLIGKIVGIGIAYGAQLLLNALFPARQPQLSNDTAERKQAYSLTGSRNQATPFEAIPVVLGQHRVTPLYAALPYTETVGDDQYLRLLFVWGYGPLAIDDLRVGETPIGSFEDCQVETYQGFPGDPPVSLYPSQVIEEPLSVDLKNVDGWHTRQTAADVNAISVDVVLPRGILAVWGNGQKKPHYFQVEAQYRSVAGGDWVSMPIMDGSLQTEDAVRRSTYVNVPTGQYDVRVRKSSNDYQVRGQEVIVEDIVWTSLRGFRPGRPVTFDRPLAVTAIRIRATSQLNGQLDTLNGVCTSLVTSFVGAGETANNPSRVPADLFRHVLQGSANARPVSNDRIDLEALRAWGGYCNANGFFFDQVRTAAAPVPDVLADIAAAGRAVPVFRDGKWAVVWDEQAAPIVQMFTPANSWGFSSTIDRRPEVHGWRVRFINREKGYVEDERIVYDDGYSAGNATLFEGLELPGVTDPGAIWRHGRFHIAQRRLRPETYSLTVGWEHLVCTRADRVRVAHDVILTGVGYGRVKSFADPFVTVDEAIGMESDRRYRLRWRTGTGEMQDRVIVAFQEGFLTRIQLDPGGPAPSQGDLFVVEELSVETGVYRVLSIDPGQDMSARLTLVDDAPEISLADRGAIPPFDSAVTRPLDLFQQPPRDLRWTEGAYQEGADFFAVVRLAWLAPFAGAVSQYQIEMSDRTISATPFVPYATVPGSQTRTEFFGLIAGTRLFRVRAIFASGGVSRWVQTETVITAGLLTPPPDVTGFAAATIGDLTTLTWGRIISAALSHFEIRFTPEVTGADWPSAVPLVARATGTSVQVPTMVGTYLIKAVSGTDLRSRNAASVRSNIAALADLNVVEIFDEAPSFAGQRERVVVEAGALRLVGRNVIQKWTSLDAVVSMDEGLPDDDDAGVEMTGTYQFAERLDLGAVYTSRISARLTAFGNDVTNLMGEWSTLDDVMSLDSSEPDDWNVSLQFRSTDADPAFAQWSAWKPFVVGDVTARALEFRVILTGRPAAVASPTYATVTPVVTGLVVEVDMPDRVVSGEDIAVPAAGQRVTFDPPFIAFKGLALAEQGLASGDYPQITNKGPTGFDIRFFNASGAAVARSIDFVAKGYGARL